MVGGFELARSRRRRGLDGGNKLARWLPKVLPNRCCQTFPFALGNLSGHSLCDSLTDIDVLTVDRQPAVP